MVISIRDCITDCTATVHLVYTEKKKKAAVLFSFLMALFIFKSRQFVEANYPSAQDASWTQKYTVWYKNFMLLRLTVKSHSRSIS